jgi:biotin transport system substrate-specific component
MTTFRRTQSALLVDQESSTLVQIVWMVGFAIATAIGARVEIPHQPVPYTLQTLIVLLAGAILGARNGAISQMMYLAAGVLGAPVFSGGSFGIAKLLGPTGGYLLSFPIAAAVVGYLLQGHRSLILSTVSMIAGLFVIFSAGTIQLYAVLFHDWAEAFKGGFLIFSWWDGIKLAAAVAIYHQTTKRQLQPPSEEI